ncbi:hypothetical protein [Lysobacter sp. ESA13C]|uniref:hypothetical protein n=1 Tax=Lysobacter sp. ESA13C TaxID=2862676 RepID=UPI001CBC7FC6|nr:hypothetical protein [Lysobacter sp. ESA13C]
MSRLTVSSKCLLCAGFAASMMCAGPAAADSLLTYVDPNTGQRHTYTAATADFSLHQAGEYLTISVQGRDGRPPSTSVLIVPPAGQTLIPGRYYEAQCPGFLFGRTPGLVVSGWTGYDCGDDPGHDGDESWGWYALRQIQRDAAGAITGAEIAYSQHFNGPDSPAVVGTIRHGVEPLSFVLNGLVAPDTYSNKGFYGDTSFFALSGSTSGVHFEVAGRRDTWSVGIKPPSGRTLQVGTYSLAEFADASHASVGVDGEPNGSSNGGYCPSVSGSLQIKSIGFDAAGKVTGLYAIFEQRCSADAPQSLNGVIHYRR